MTRARKLTDEQVRQAKELHNPGVFGYERIGKVLNVPASTVRDAVLQYTAYSSRIK
jgi:hypothetical protein